MKRSDSNLSRYALARVVALEARLPDPEARRELARRLRFLVRNCLAREARKLKKSGQNPLNYTQEEDAESAGYLGLVYGISRAHERANRGGEDDSILRYLTTCILNEIEAALWTRGPMIHVPRAVKQGHSYWSGYAQLLPGALNDQLDDQENPTLYADELATWDLMELCADPPPRGKRRRNTAPDSLEWEVVKLRAGRLSGKLSDLEVAVHLGVSEGTAKHCRLRVESRWYLAIHYIQIEDHKLIAPLIGPIRVRRPVRQNFPKKIPA